MKLRTCLVLLLVLAGCGSGDRTRKASDEDSARREGGLTRDEAVAVAARHLAEEPFADTIDTKRVTTAVKYFPYYGPDQKRFECWSVDFAKVGTREIVEDSGLWEAGYRVLVNPDNGEVIEASRYDLKPGAAQDRAR